MKNITIKILLIILFCAPLFKAQSKDSVQVKDTTFVMKKSPWGAVLRSAVVPGLGQIYNQSYWKAPVVWGVSGWFVYNWLSFNKQYKDNKKLYSDNMYGNHAAYYREHRDVARDNRDLFAIYLGITYFLNLVDAYVDAHLFDF
ncbi:MAG: DUF5683 domain-containing protein, partial [Bacteroidota bacterium]|nr:DUF5683 domain-containing protein [Bacteroidota bacterium]